MAIIRENPRMVRGQQTGGAMRPSISQFPYEKSPLRRVMEPGLTAFGTQLGGQLGATLGKGAGDFAVGEAGGLFTDKSIKPADMLASANARELSMMQEIGAKSYEDMVARRKAANKDGKLNPDDPKFSFWTDWDENQQTKRDATKLGYEILQDRYRSQ